MQSARNVIIGTDWWTDCDDVAAMRVFARACREGVFNPLGAVINACMPYSAPSLSAFMDSEGLSGVPIGIDREATDYGGNPPYQRPLCAFEHSVKSNDECEDALTMYRRLLANARDVEIIEIGYPQALSALIESEGDEHSPISGALLVKERVKRAWIMAGNWEMDGRGRENNFARNARASRAAHKLLEAWPTPITFLGWEVAANVLVGGECARREPDSPLGTAFRAHGSLNGRSAWDPMLVRLAAVGDARKAGFAVRRGCARVNPETGENSFVYDPNGPHEYVVKTMPDEAYAREIDSLL